jgi:hypothetical protein
MLILKLLKTYIPRAVIAAAVYCITVVIFLSHENYQSIWILFLGNVLYMLSIIVIVYLSYRANSFKQSPLTSAISGHILSLTGAALSVILSLLLYLLYDLIIRSSQGETLQNAPAGFSSNSTHGMLFILVILAAFGNSVAGFFGALFTSFDASKKQANDFNT